jgi:hypothetical protein
MQRGNAGTQPADLVARALPARRGNRRRMGMPELHSILRPVILDTASFAVLYDPVLASGCDTCIRPHSPKLSKR